MDHRGTLALVTGASSGIGAEFARRLADLGADVVLVGRREDALRTHAELISARTGRTTHVIALDLGEPGAARELRERIRALHLDVDTVINCAGSGLTRAFAASSAAEIGAQLQLNVIALTEATHEFLPDLVRSGRGALVNVGSLTGYMPVPGMAVYAAAKSYVIRFTEALAHELRETGVKVLALSPGPTRTEFFARSSTSADGARFETPEQVVTTALRALERRQPPVSIISGRSNRIIRWTVGLLPKRAALAAAESRPASAA